jgi:hypothetical protein
MVEEIEIGQMYGELTVTGILPAVKILCECSCGSEVRTIARELVQGSRVRCKKCDRKLHSPAALSADLAELEGLNSR